MPDRLIDTNILVYAYDISESTKHDIAKDILKQIWQDGGGVVCVQNLMEFFVVITKKGILFKFHGGFWSTDEC
jgi:predicted nucleic acid-binding protein